MACTAHRTKTLSPGVGRFGHGVQVRRSVKAPDEMHTQAGAHIHNEDYKKQWIGAC